MLLKNLANNTDKQNLWYSLNGTRQVQKLEPAIMSHGLMGLKLEKGVFSEVKIG
uniref:Uncharacterized protein n=1 Tax=Rhizophora mucronata TaxID=61149 RepID=A0A2P2NR90_RHIMU